MDEDEGVVVVVVKKPKGWGCKLRTSWSEPAMPSGAWRPPHPKVVIQVEELEDSTATRRRRRKKRSKKTTQPDRGIFVGPNRFRLIAIFSGAVWIVVRVATVDYYDPDCSAGGSD
ncbi:hypothetical protein AAG570_005889 [Ranatra chinensis]|uniref:Uncharacterized protein n=1 Tax=Ranatra chinensis TaxID=642074 RepID=A0ABD0XWF5_9HEMI